MEQISKRDSKLFNKVIAQLGNYSHFTNEIKDGKLHLKGRLDIGFGKNNQYEIEIIVSNKFPRQIPEVHETSGRVPSVMDRHFMSDNSGCCLVMPHLYRQFFTPRMTFEDFINILVVPFFQNQLYYEINGRFVQGYKHGEYGIWEHYFELFGEDLQPKILYKLADAVLMERVDGKARIKGHKLCPCESGVIQRKCHGKGLISLKQFGSSSKLRDTINWLRQEELMKRLRKGEKITPPPNYSLKVQNISIEQLPTIPQNGVVMYEIPKIKPGSYMLTEPVSLIDDETKASTKA